MERSKMRLPLLRAPARPRQASTRSTQHCLSEGVVRCPSSAGRLLLVSSSTAEHPLNRACPRCFVFWAACLVPGKTCAECWIYADSSLCRSVLLSGRHKRCGSVADSKAVCTDMIFSRKYGQCGLTVVVTLGDLCQPPAHMSGVYDRAIIPEVT